MIDKYVKHKLFCQNCVQIVHPIHVDMIDLWKDITEHYRLSSTDNTSNCDY